MRHYLSRLDPLGILVLGRYLMVLLWAVQVATAQLPSTVSIGRDYLRTDFTVEDGLPSNIVHSILQTRDGFLWVGTHHGLLRYDGHHFTTFGFLPRELAGTSINTLAEAVDGSLWVGTASGVAHIARSVLKQLGPASSDMYHPGSGARDHIECLQIAPDGTVWVGTDGGLFHFERGAFICVIPDLWISRIQVRSGGHLLIVTSIGVREWDGQRIVDQSDLSRKLGVALNEVFDVFEDRTGTIWYCTAAGIARQRLHERIERLEPYGRNRGSVTFRAFQDASGTMWFNGLKGLSRSNLTGIEMFSPGLHASYLTFDRDGNLWAGTNGSGLIHIKKRAVYMFTTADGLPNNVVKAVLADRSGRVWVGMNCGGLAWYDGARFHSYSEKDGLTASCVFSLAEDGNGLWIGTYGGGLFRFRNGQFSTFSNPDRLTNRIVYAIVPARDGSLWVAYSDGLSHIQDGKTRSFSSADGLSSNSIWSIFQDLNGVIWVQTSAGIDRFESGRFEAISSTREATFAEDGLGELFAIVPRTGTFRILGKDLIKLSRAPEINSMVRSQSDLWFCGKGIYRAAANSLKEWTLEGDAPPDYTTFGYRDGLSSSECSAGFHDMAITPDGKLWAATTKGLAMLNPSTLPHGRGKPAIYVENVVVGTSLLSPATELRVAPGLHHLEIHFDAIEIESPERIRFQYRLDGVDKEWLNAEGLSAVYTGLPVGTHAFHIRACNGDGVWNREGIVYNITQQPYFYETPFFRVMVAAVGVFFLIALYQLRLRQLAAQMNLRLEERVAERTRIARELHDTLIQEMNGLSLQIAALSKVAIAPETAKERLRELKRQAEYCLREARQSVWDIRSADAGVVDLATALRESGEQLCVGKNIRFALVIEGDQKSIAPAVRQQLVRIGREAIANAVQHAQANRIEVRLLFGKEALHLKISDDGSGFDLLNNTPKAAGHFGLSTMRERADQIHARIQISSTVGEGTCVLVTIPDSE